MSASERRESVEILRGVAAFSVMWFHLTNLNPSPLPTNSLLRASGSYGYLGVQLFFVISGFIIPYSLSLRGYQIHTDGLNFLGRRIARIEPAYLVSALLMVVVQIAPACTPGSHAIIPASGLLASSALHLAYLAPWFGVPWFSPVYWSLAIEFQYYIAMLLFAPLLLSARRSGVYLFLLPTAALSLIFHDARTLFPYLPLFGLGFVRFLAFRGLLHWVELSIWTVIFFGLSWRLLEREQALAALFALGFLFLPLKRPAPVLSFLGAISYSLYLIHIPVGLSVFNLVVRLPPASIAQLLAVSIAAGASIFAAYCFWRFIEKPSAKFSKSIGSGRGQPTYCAATSDPRIEGRLPIRAGMLS